MLRVIVHRWWSMATNYRLVLALAS